MVNEQPQVNGNSGGGVASVAIGFVIGALLGAGVALLLAPGSGRETRDRLTDAGRRMKGAARDGLDLAREKIDLARETTHDLKHDAKSALEAGREAFELSRKSHQEGSAKRTEAKG